jgi:hypothetical protein
MCVSDVGAFARPLKRGHGNCRYIFWLMTFLLSALCSRLSATLRLRCAIMTQTQTYNRGLVLPVLGAVTQFLSGACLLSVLWAHRFPQPFIVCP